MPRRLTRPGDQDSAIRFGVPHVVPEMILILSLCSPHPNRLALPIHVSQVHDRIGRSQTYPRDRIDALINILHSNTGVFCVAVDISLVLFCFPNRLAPPSNAILRARTRILSHFHTFSHTLMYITMSCTVDWLTHMRISSCLDRQEGQQNHSSNAVDNSSLSSSNFPKIPIATDSPRLGHVDRAQKR